MGSFFASLYGQVFLPEEPAPTPASQHRTFKTPVYLLTASPPSGLSEPQTSVIASNLRMTPNPATGSRPACLPLPLIIDELFRLALFKSLPSIASEQEARAEEISGKLYHYDCTTRRPHSATSCSLPRPGTGTNHPLYRCGLHCTGCMGANTGLPV